MGRGEEGHVLKLRNLEVGGLSEYSYKRHPPKGEVEKKSELTWERQTEVLQNKTHIIQLLQCKQWILGTGKVWQSGYSASSLENLEELG